MKSIANTEWFTETAHSESIHGLNDCFAPGGGGVVRSESLKVATEEKLKRKKPGVMSFLGFQSAPS